MLRFSIRVNYDNADIIKKLESFDFELSIR